MDPLAIDGEQQVLGIWASSGAPRLARRAWLVQQASQGRSIVELSQASGVPSRRIAGLLTSYRRLGLCALVDAPRSGRPVAADDVARPDPVGHAPWKDWRAWRELALNEGGRTRRLPWPAVEAGMWSQIRAVAAGPDVTVVLLRQGTPPAVAGGMWCFPRFDLLLQGTPVSSRTHDWRMLAERLTTASPVRDRPRPAMERRRLWLRAVLHAVTDPSDGRARALLLGGNPSSAEFLDWLAALRPLLQRLSDGHARLQPAVLIRPQAWCDRLVTSVGGRRAAVDATAIATASWLWRPPSHLWWVADQC